jgi:hypothetical protein
VRSLYSRDQFLRTPKGLEAHHRVGHFLHGSVVLLYDVVEIFRLAPFNVQTGIYIDGFDRSCVGTAFADSDLLEYAVQIDGSLKATPCSRYVTFGIEEEVCRVTCFVDSTVQIFPLASYLYVSHIRPQTCPHSSLAPPKNERQYFHYFHRPPVYGGVIDKDAAL